MTLADLAWIAFFIGGVAIGLLAIGVVAGLVWLHDRNARRRALEALEATKGDNAP